jgi:hypothetical protein
METTVVQPTTHNHVELTGKSRQVRRVEERKRNKPKPTIKPTKGNPGAIERYEDFGGDALLDLKDIFMNHHQDQCDETQRGSLKTHWRFTKDLDDPTVYALERWELDNTGKGMNEETVNGKYISVLKYKDLEDPSGGGVFSIGEKNGFRKWTKRNKKLRERGIETLTKMKDMPFWYHMIYDPVNEKFVKEPDFYTYDEVLNDLKLPVDQIGEESGTYIKWHISIETIQETWFKDLTNLLNLYFSDCFKTYWDATLELDTQSVIMKPKTVSLDGVVVSSTSNGGNGEAFAKTEVDYYGVNYDLHHCIRIPSDDPNRKDFANFDRQYGYRRAFKSDITYGVKLPKTGTRNIGDNLILLFNDKKRLWSYEIRVVMSGDLKRRGVFKFMIEKEQLDVNTTKDMATLLDLDDKPREQSAETTRMKMFLSSLYPVDNTWNETAIRDQTLSILHGEKWPKGWRSSNYEDVAELHYVPEEYYFDWEWARDHLTKEHTIPGTAKRTDIWNSYSKALSEYKPKEPTTTEDHDQIVSAQSLSDCKYVTTFGVSNTKKPFVRDINAEFDSMVRQRFTSELNNHPIKRIAACKWSLVDLRYLGLHERLEMEDVK